jgi:ABC-type Fe3+/spermidine/putrescine transport system ATPase subunit
MVTANAMISIRDVTKTFGQVRAVDRVGFDIGQGEFFSLLGPSGCGKTTLLRMLAGFESPTEGEILIDGAPMSTVPPNHRPTNMVFQSYAIFPHLNVRDNIAYGLVRKKLREEMQLELRLIQRDVGITFVFVTHDQEEALTMSDRIAVMSKGKVLQIDHAAALYEHPNCREVAEFIGTMNVFEGRLLSVSGGVAQVDAGPVGRLLAPVNGSAGLAPGSTVSVAVRPEKLELSAEKPADGNAIAGRRQAEAYLGDRSHYYVEAQGLPKPIAAAAQNVRRSAGTSPAGEAVWVHWPVEAGVLLTH